MGDVGLPASDTVVKAPQFLVASAALTQPTVRLSGAEFRHVRARRLDVGDQVLLCDGTGQQRVGVLTALEHDHATITLHTDIPDTPSAAPTLPLTLCQALLKGLSLIHI